MATTDYRIQLNMLQITGGIDRFTIFRRHASPDDSRPAEDCARYSLPQDQPKTERAQFWVTLNASEGFEPYEASSADNNHLTIHVLREAIKRTAQSHLSAGEFVAFRDHFDSSLKLVMVEHAEGSELLVVEPYLLKTTGTFGFLVDFHFRKNPDIQFSRKVQQLSLSLDTNNRRNLAYYSQRSSKVRTFLEMRKEFFAALTLPNSSAPLIFSREYPSLPAMQLGSKTYIHGSDRPARSQFSGLRQNGPLKPLTNPPVVLFCFREQDRHAARKLAMALRGQAKPDKLGFDGFKSIFKTDITVDANPHILPDLTKPSFEAALTRVQSDRKATSDLIPVFVLPDGDDNGYHTHKAIFAHAGIPTQVCTLPVIVDDYALKWSIANIALQLFCKAGGLPWKVQPTSKKTLILGISQSHKVREVGGKRTIDKYFAFSVMTDNSGLFQRIHVLGESTQRTDYFSQLKSNLITALNCTDSQYERVVIHTSFRLRRDEMETVSAAVGAVASEAGTGREFAVVRINHKSRFFGVNRSVNSLVPYEGTSVSLGAGQFLIWFEGIFREKTTVNKAFPGPTFVEVLRMSAGDYPDVAPILQDLINLSGANWRGFNAKSAPVSVFYCHLVADLVHDFHEQGLPLPKITDLKPWFL